MTLRVGSVIYGFCDGVFGRDSYEEKRVEALGADWIVCRDPEGNVHFASGTNVVERLEDYLKRLNMGR